MESLFTVESFVLQWGDGSGYVPQKMGLTEANSYAKLLN